jgi:hypothetical protein
MPESKMLLVEEDMALFETIFMAFVKKNMPDLSKEKLELTKGMFMAGALAFYNLNNALHDSEMPFKQGLDLYVDIIATIEEKAFGVQVPVSVKGIVVPPKKERH